MLTEKAIHENKFHDIAHFGIRASIAAIFIFHSIKKFNPAWQQWLIDHGLPPELQIPIALAEFLGGIFLISGILTRISSAIYAVILLGAIFMIKGMNKFSGGDFTGWEFDLVMLASVLSIIAAGPGRVSISHIIKKIPKFLE